MPGGNCAKMDLHLLLEDYFTKKEQLERITAVLQEELLKVPNSEKLLAVKGIGIITVAGFLAEVGDLRVYLKTPQHCPILPERHICCVAFACIPQRSAALMRLASAPFWRIVQHF